MKAAAMACSQDLGDRLMTDKSSKGWLLAGRLRVARPSAEPVARRLQIGAFGGASRAASFLSLSFSRALQDSPNTRVFILEFLPPFR